MSHVLAVDQGTSGTKAIVVDDAGRVVSIAEVALRPRYLPGGGVEQDPEALWDSVVDAGRRALAEAGVPVAAVALANQGETVLAWDRATGRPLSPAIVWQDRRSETICADLAGSAAAVARHTGLVLDPYFSAPKMAWIRANLTIDGVVTTTDTWLVHRLCGAFVTDVSTASRSLLLDLDSATWRGDLLELFGAKSERLTGTLPPIGKDIEPWTRTLSADKTIRHNRPPTISDWRRSNPGSAHARLHMEFIRSAT